MGADGALEPALMLASQSNAELHMLLAMELSRLPTTVGEVDEEKTDVDRRSAFIVASAQCRAAELGVWFQTHAGTANWEKRLFGSLVTTGSTCWSSDPSKARRCSPHFSVIPFIA